MNERSTAISPRAAHDSQPGARLRAAIRPAADSRTPKKVDSTAIWMLSTMPSAINASLSAAMLGGNMRARKWPPFSSPLEKPPQVIASVDVA